MAHGYRCTITIYTLRPISISISTNIKSTFETIHQIYSCLSFLLLTRIERSRLFDQTSSLVSRPPLPRARLSISIDTVFHTRDSSISPPGTITREQDDFSISPPRTRDSSSPHGRRPRGHGARPPGARLAEPPLWPAPWLGAQPPGRGCCWPS